MSHLKSNRIKWLLSVTMVIGFFSLVPFGCVSQNATTGYDQSSVSSDRPADAPADRIVESVVVTTQTDTVNVTINANRKLLYTTIKQSFPFGIAIHLPDTRISENFTLDLPENGAVEDVSADYVNDAKTAVKIVILLKEDISYTVNESDTSLVCSLQDSRSVKRNESVLSAAPAPAAGQDNSRTTESAPLTIPDTAAKLTDIQFTTDQDGNSNIVIKTDHPIRYTITQTDDHLLNLNLLNTRVPDYHQRPLITNYFKSAVERILPAQNDASSDSVVKIQLRDTVPYHIIQTHEGLFLTFEPTDLTPPVFAKARKQVTDSDAAGSQETALDGAAESDTPQNLEEEDGAPAKSDDQLMEEIFGPPKVYTGEKIKLDFYETDIKNVFRILRSVSGMNFAIDEDVTGKVTMTLDSPVPWDQILDLVLKMNDLGKKQEGNVIRIATTQTLKNEELHRKELIDNKREQIEARKKLAPLITEYITINYSDAKTDISPHIKEILSEDRGKLSVDERTNTIILTDTAEVIQQAKSIIYRLDKVTPQIMIEAKVVEVSDNFNRKLGVGLRLYRGQTDLSYNKPDYGLALNAEPGEEAAYNFGSFNLYRILGSTNTWLNAELSASEVKGDIKIVSSPRILTLNGTKAMIKQGLEIPYVLETVDDGEITKSILFKQVDLLLEATPHVTPDDRINMVLHLTKNDIDAYVGGVPSISTNEAQTELLIDNNETIIIGGVVKKSISNRKSGTPFLQDIPGLGRLFRTDSVNNARTELMIFLTPKIVQLKQKRTDMTAVQ